MGLFDKKYCDVCGEKIGLLGNRKLADGNLCKNCAKKLSPWFSDRKQSTVAEIREQLEWREENKDLVDGFRASQVIGKGPYVLIDESGGTFTVADTVHFDKEENPDILDLASITGVNTDVTEHRSEVYRKDKDGKNVSYNPPRYDYSYDFYCTIFVDCPFYSEMKFRLNTLSVKIENVQRTSILQQFHPEYDAKYQSYLILGDDIKKKLLGAKDRVMQTGTEGNSSANGTGMGASAAP